MPDRKHPSGAREKGRRDRDVGIVQNGSDEPVEIDGQKQEGLKQEALSRLRLAPVPLQGFSAFWNSAARRPRSPSSIH